MHFHYIKQPTDIFNALYNFTMADSEKNLLPKYAIYSGFQNIQIAQINPFRLQYIKSDQRAGMLDSAIYTNNYNVDCDR